MRAAAALRRFAVGLALAAVASGAAAQSLLGAREWLPPGSLSLEALSQRPAEHLDGGPRQGFFAAYGRLAFRSPDILGGNARRAGLSCQACHANGYAVRAFFIPDLSDRPGRIDVTTAFWSLRGEDHVRNPVAIPSLRGVRTKARFGHDDRGASLRDFTRRVIVLEFDGAEPAPLLLDALVAYQERLGPAAEHAEPVTLERDLADIRLHLEVLAVPLAEEDAPLAADVAAMIRGQLGLVHERFADAALRDSRAALEQWSLALAGIAAAAGRGAWPEARRSLTGLDAAIAAPPPVLAAEAPLSLYAQQRLREWLSRPVP